MKFYAPKYKQLDLGLLRSSLDELVKTNRWVALGDLPATILADKIYLNRANRDILGDFEIQDGQSHRGAQRNRMLIRYWQENISNLLRHYEGLRLLPSVCDRKLIQQTLIDFDGQTCCIIIHNVFCWNTCIAR